MKKHLMLFLTICFVLFSFGCATQNYKVLKEVDRENAEDWLRMADLLYKVNDYAFAARLYEMIIEDYPDSAYAIAASKRAKVSKSRYLRHLKMGSKFKSRRNVKQPKDYSLLFGDDRKNAENLLKQANLLYRVRDYGDAVDYYKEIIETYPDSIYSFISSGRLKSAKKRHLRDVKSF